MRPLFNFICFSGFMVLLYPLDITAQNPASRPVPVTPVALRPDIQVEKFMLVAPKAVRLLVFNTVEYGTNATSFDHGWNALEVSKDG